MRQQNTKATEPLDVVPGRRSERCSRDFGLDAAFGAKSQIPVAMQGGRETLAPRANVTEPFRPLSLVNIW